MRCGLFGKLSAKRDFIALTTPRSFLEIWEPWVQACMSASQHQLGGGWQNTYLTAPLWRFWLGANVAGVTVSGVMMPSVDGIGRYYPLTLLAATEPGYAIPPPDQKSQDQWFAAAEAFLLATLERDKSFEQIAAALDALSPLDVEATASSRDGVMCLNETTTGTVAADRSFQDALALTRRANHAASAAATMWWTEGGGGFPPTVLTSRGLPDPFIYTAMLTGGFSAMTTDDVAN